MKKTLYLFFTLTSFMYGQDKVGINIGEPTAKLHVNGNMRVQTVKTLDYSVITENGFSGQSRYKALYWDSETKEIFTKVLDQPYVRLDASYIDNQDANAPGVDIPLNPNDYFLFLTDVSVMNPESKPSNRYLIGVKDVESEAAMPVPGFELKPEGNSYKFKAFYKHSIGGKLYYYDSQDTTVLDPTNSIDAPIWVGSIFAVSKKYMEPLYDITVNYQSYWEANSGGRYGIELGKLIDENKNTTTTVSATLDAQRNIEVK